MQTMSQINQLKGVLDQVVTENKQLKEQLNTMLNRMQGEGGLGNVGAFKTGGK
jgi:regulator of replication initiation timing